MTIEEALERLRKAEERARKRAGDEADAWDNPGRR